MFQRVIAAARRSRPVCYEAAPLAAATTLSVLCVYLVAARSPDLPDGRDKSLWFHLGLLAAYLFALVLPAGAAVYALYRAVAAPTLLRGVAVLVAAYLSLVVCFASGYFLVAWQGDMDDAVDQWAYYRQVKFYLSHNPRAKPVPRDESRREFRGVEPRLWSGIADGWEDRYYSYDGDGRIERILTRVDQDVHAPAYFKFEAEHVTPVYLDCLHYSIVTVATVGYGDISPAGRGAKVLTDLQIVAGQGLFLFAIGLVLTKKPPGRTGTASSPDAATLQGGSGVGPEPSRGGGRSASETASESNR